MAMALKILDASQSLKFQAPSKKINDIPDVARFHNSQAYADIVTFLFQLNVSVFPRQISPGEGVRRWESGSTEEELPQTVKRLRELIAKLESIIDEVPPDRGPRRFGNVSFRRWYGIVEERMKALLEEHLPESVLFFEAGSRQERDGGTTDGHFGPLDEISGYFVGSFGSAQRLDYGTGHELSFLAFLAVIWRLGGFHGGSRPGAHDSTAQEAGMQERLIVLGVMDPYFRLVRRLIKTYTLEPAGSHGVWGLDDHFFLPYIFGSAQYCPAIASVTERLPVEGSIEGAPEALDITKLSVVKRERMTNMYFAAVGFINDVKKGPFWEHSRVLFDISGVSAGWAKINKGMLKMYNVEVLSKFPVVQHFPFGGVLSWDALEPGQSHLTTALGIDENAASGRGDAGTSSNIHSVIQQTDQSESSLPSLNPASSLNQDITTAAPWSRIPPAATSSLQGSIATARMPAASTGAAAVNAFARGSPATGTMFPSGTTIPGATSRMLDSTSRAQTGYGVPGATPWLTPVPGSTVTGTSMPTTTRPRGAASGTAFPGSFPAAALARAPIRSQSLTGNSATVSQHATKSSSPHSTSSHTGTTEGIVGVAHPAVSGTATGSRQSSATATTAAGTTHIDPASADAKTNVKDNDSSHEDTRKRQAMAPPPLPSARPR
ncbi:MAG: Serine/threonine-protein phosphatase 2A activator 1 [Lichina confinis]|nr:MAG: Serine/threonine-protein phosphatase 2A activator 1 [Lichina confinis]